MINLLILAAGMGSRYGGVKQIDPIGPNGELIIDYSIYDAKKVGIDKFIFLIRKELEGDFRELIETKYKGTLNYDFAFQELEYGLDNPSFCENRAKPWGTGHAVLCAEKKLEGNPFVVINADDFYGASAFDISTKFLKNNKNFDFGLVSYLLSNTLSNNGSVSRGVCELDENDYLKSIIEVKNIEKINDKIVSDHKNIVLTDDSLVSMNLWMFDKNVFKFLNKIFNDHLNIAKDKSTFEFYIPLFIDDLKNIIKTKVFKSQDEWFGVTYKEDKDSVVEKINALIESGVYPQRLY